MQRSKRVFSRPATPDGRATGATTFQCSAALKYIRTFTMAGCISRSQIAPPLNKYKPLACVFLLQSMDLPARTSSSSNTRRSVTRDQRTRLMLSRFRHLPQVEEITPRYRLACTRCRRIMQLGMFLGHSFHCKLIRPHLPASLRRNPPQGMDMEARRPRTCPCLARMSRILSNECNSNKRLPTTESDAHHSSTSTSSWNCTETYERTPTPTLCGSSVPIVSVTKLWSVDDHRVIIRTRVRTVLGPAALVEAVGTMLPLALRTEAV